MAWKILDILDDSAPGRAILASIFWAARKGHVDRAKISRLLDVSQSNFDAEKDRLNPGADLHHAVLSALANATLELADDIVLQRKPDVFAMPEEDLSRVVQLYDIVGSAHALLDRRRLMNQGEHPDCAWTNESVFELLEDPERVAASVRTGATLRGRLPLFWVAPQSDLPDTLHDRRRPTDSTRSMLGLGQFSATEILVEIRIPKNAMATVQTTAPTFIEACGNPWFLPCDDSDGWGRAAELGRVLKGEGRREIEGARELVSSPLEYTPQLTLHGLGRPTANQADSFTDEMVEVWLDPFVSHAGGLAKSIHDLEWP